MNIDNEDVNLCLALSPTTYTNHTRLKNNSGAGVNSGSTMNMEFAASDHPLSELVWSRQNGLSLRCTNCNSDKKPLLLWNVGPRGNDLSPSHQSMRSNGDAVDGEDLIISQAVVDEADTLVGPSRSFRTPEFCASRGECDCKNDSMIEKGNCMDEVLCCPQNVENAGFADISRKDAGLNSSADGISDCCKVDQTINGLVSAEPVTWKLPEAPVCSPPNLKALTKSDHEITSASVETDKNKTNTPLPIPAFPLKKPESSAHRITVYRGKGKEKALSHSDEESHTSVQSCNDARLFSKKGIKRRIDGDDDDQGLNHGSKQMKRMDSSFMKWILNLVKGLPDSTTTVKEDSSSALALTLTFPNNGEKKSDTGLQTIFQSLHCSNTDMSDNGMRNENDNSCKQIVLCDKEVMNPINIISMEKKLTHEKSSTLNSWWVTRFSTRTRRLEKCDEFTQETDVGPMFQSEKLKNPTFSVKCFFCGNGHDLRKCPDVTENELEDLILKTSSFGDVEESSCFCVRCFQLDHWAVSCPLAPSNGGSFISSHYTACHLQLSAGKRVSNSNVPNSANDVKYNKMFPLCKIVTDKNKVGVSEIFHAIRNLRLSRSDILRCIDSNVSLSNLNGFFVRLRLGKMEKGVRATSYYVACLTGDAREHNGCKSKKSILVDVGGVKASVGSRSVSKNDFLEDEIKAWWCRTVDSGCKIPSLDELNSKLNNRKFVGF